MVNETHEHGCPAGGGQVLWPSKSHFSDIRKSRPPAVNPIAPVHLFGTDDDIDTWDRIAVAGSYRHRMPTAGDLMRIASESGPAIVALAGRVSPKTLAEVEPGPDVTIVVTRPAAATGGRASADLAADLWRIAPGVAALLGEHLLEVGAVVLPGGRLGQLELNFGESVDPFTQAVTAIMDQGGTLRVTVVGPLPDASPPSNPSPLTPRTKSGRRWLANLLEQFDDWRWLGDIRSFPDAHAVKAGLWLWHDFLDESHSVSQSIEGEGRRSAGDYWHAIMHRREPDYGNAKYWFRRVGRQPIFETLADRVPRLVADAGEAGGRLLRRVAPGGVWDPMAFIDACAEAERTGDTTTDLLLRRIQADEILLLLRQTCEDALA